MTSVRAITTLVVFIASLFLAIHPISTPNISYMPRIQINLTTAPVLAIISLWATGCLDPAVIHNGIVGTESIKPYNIVIIFFSLSYMAITLDITGTLHAIVYWVLKSGGYNTRKLYLYVYVTLTLLSSVLGNEPIIHFGTAYLVHYTAVTSLDLIPWTTVAFTAPNIGSMVLFTGSPMNVVICESFGIDNAAFTAYTILPFLTCSFLCFSVLAFQFRTQIPLELHPTDHPDLRLALLDPVGALVGSLMLGTALILCLVSGFIGIDAWMISLPFAAGKFLFDLTWDHYRYARGIPMLGRSSPKATGKLGHDRPNTSEMVPAEASSSDAEQSPCLPVDEEAAVVSRPLPPSPPLPPTSPPPSWLSIFNPGTESQNAQLHWNISLMQIRSHIDYWQDRLDQHFPTAVNALPRLPFTLIPFTFSLFILVEALEHQGWIDFFAGWLVRACAHQVHRTIWLIGVLGVILCNVSGTNIGAAILLTKIVRAAALPHNTNRGAAIALAVALNIGSVNFMFSASRSGLLWRAILGQEGVCVSPKDFALRNLLPLLVMTTVGLATVSAVMAIV